MYPAHLVSGLRRIVTLMPRYDGAMTGEDPLRGLQGAYGASPVAQLRRVNEFRSSNRMGTRFER